ncbi:MAG TPA: RluA family pseudouridine synthase [Bacilli bacterium]|nr:RluA family pseudouridine synthase [Bacilli bacterium]HQA55647.1 RluA family pseudouridine synthase [Bacilli bacterium]
MNKNDKSKRSRTIKKDYRNIKQFPVKQKNELLAFLFEVFPKQSRNSVKSLLSSHRVSVDGAPVSQFDFKLVPGDTVIITSSPIRKKTRSRLPIIYEDSEFIVINKPSGLLSVASDTEKGSTAYRMLSDYVQQKDKHNRIFVIHRLDEDTSGVLMVAKNSSIQQKLQDSWNELVSKRGYYAIVEGKMESPKGTIKSYLKKNKQNMMYSSKKAGDGQLAITNYEVIQENEQYSLLDVNIETGRKNQIRVHLGELGHHVVGDDKYGKPSDPLKRLGLHAYCLELKHPSTGEVMKFSAPMPKEFSILFGQKK